jgi:4-hydroxybenzoate polyprenyltransferase
MSRVRAYAQLIRLPNVFTALADICLGALASDRWGSAPVDWALSFGCLLVSSAALYCSGMVWNDIFDIAQDRRERPGRPLPSGQVTRRAAVALAAGLMSAGIALAAVAAWMREMDRSPLWLALVLAGAILLYDGWLKRTWAGPLGMGACRFLNVLLGLSLGGAAQAGWGIHLAAVVGLYIVGVTWFARTEARASRPGVLAAAATVMGVALVLALTLPLWFPLDTTSPLFPYLLVILGFLVGVPVVRAVGTPAPGLVQAAVKRAIMGLVVLDATLATGLVGWTGLTILLLLGPALYLGRWIYST